MEIMLLFNLALFWSLSLLAWCGYLHQQRFRQRSDAPRDQANDQAIAAIAADQSRQQLLEELRVLVHSEAQSYLFLLQQCLVTARTAEDAQTRYAALVHALSQTERLRQTICQLPDTLEQRKTPDDLEWTISETLHYIAKACPSCHIQCSVQGQCSAPLPDAIRAALVLMLYNATTNALQHAQPRELRVVLRYEPDAVTLSVLNDGEFPHNILLNGRGIADTERHVLALGGRFSIGGDPIGIRVAACLPLQPDAVHGTPAVLHSDEPWSGAPYAAAVS